MFWALDTRIDSLSSENNIFADQFLDFRSFEPPFFKDGSRVGSENRGIVDLRSRVLEAKREPGDERLLVP